MLKRQEKYLRGCVIAHRDLAATARVFQLVSTTYREFGRDNVSQNILAGYGPKEWTP